MAETMPEWHDQKIQAVAVLEQPIPAVQWYDQREPVTSTVRYGIEYKMVTTIVEYIMRECFYCRKTWRERWRERNEV